MNRKLSAAVAAVLAVQAMPVLAEDDLALEEVVVTAQRRSENIQDVPIAIQALTGVMAITGEPDGPPLKAGVALVDLMAGKDAAIAVLGALAGRDHLHTVADAVTQALVVGILVALLVSVGAVPTAILGPSPERPRLAVAAPDPAGGTAESPAAPTSTDVPETDASIS